MGSLELFCTRVCISLEPCFLCVPCFSLSKELKNTKTLRERLKRIRKRKNGAFESSFQIILSCNLIVSHVVFSLSFYARYETQK